MSAGKCNPLKKIIHGITAEIKSLLAQMENIENLLLKMSHALISIAIQKIIANTAILVKVKTTVNKYATRKQVNTLRKPL